MKKNAKLNTKYFLPFSYDIVKIGDWCLYKWAFRFMRMKVIDIVSIDEYHYVKTYFEWNIYHINSMSYIDKRPRYTTLIDNILWTYN